MGDEMCIPEALLPMIAIPVGGEREPGQGLAHGAIFPIPLLSAPAQRCEGKVRTRKDC